VIAGIKPQDENIVAVNSTVIRGKLKMINEVILEIQMCFLFYNIKLQKQV
jgi:hypothetical protein